MKIILPTKKFNSDIGDVWVPKQVRPYLGKFVSKDFQYLMSFQHITPLIVKVPRLMGIENLEVFKNVKSTCPYTGNRYYCLLPVAILSNELTKYRELVNPMGWYKLEENGKTVYHDIYAEMAKDAMIEMQETNSQPTAWFSFGSIEACLLGSGYSSGRIKSDGGREWQWTTLALDNGDALLCVVLIWFNK